MSADDRIDLSALDPGDDSAVESRVVGGAMRRIHATAGRVSWWSQASGDIAEHWLPLLGIAASLLAAAGFFLSRAERATAPPRPSPIERELGVPAVMSEWMAGGRPTTGELWSMMTAGR